MYYKEDINFLKKWISQVKQLAIKIRDKSRQDNTISSFTIGSTTQHTKNLLPYMTPIRKILYGYLGGVIVFTQTQGRIVSKTVDGIVDYILVDAEKKLPIIVDNFDNDLYETFNLKKITKKNSVSYFDMGNLSASCVDDINQSLFFEYKANDLTVDSVWYHLSSHFKILSGKKISIIGGGNIGFKIALKLVESGCQINFVRRDINKGLLLANAINFVKPISTVSSVNFIQDTLKACLYSDAIVACTDGVPVVTWEMIQCMKEKGIVVDVGKGCIADNVLEKAIDSGISVFRTDVYSGLEGTMSSIIRNHKIISKFGRKKLNDNFYLISSGLMGKYGDIVVDDIDNPKQIIGICDGKGNLLTEYNEDQNKIITKLKMGNV